MAKATLTYGGHSYTIQVERQDGTAELSWQKDDAPAVTAQADVDLREPWVHVRMDGRTYRCLAVHDADGVWVTWAGRTWFLKPERARAATTAAAHALHAEVRAPMTGTVIKVHVESGATVSAGQLLAVMEAMKMEYRLEAPADARVERVHCRPGDLLNVGALLIELAPAAGA